jgi:NAD(P)-dependent dehydrogenase (short-subunit alcohol dehydrogenase family)
LEKNYSIDLELIFMTTSEKPWIMITGASTGIGRATTEYLASHKMGVFAGARKSEDLDQLSQVPNVIPLKMDVTIPEDIDNAVVAIEDHQTGLFGVVNNAGFSVLGQLMDLTDTDLERQFQTNFFGVHRVTKAMFPLLKQAHGRIVMISSVNGLVAVPNNGPYCASKFALEGYSDSLRREIAPLGMGVSIIEPGLIKTKIWDKAALSLENMKQSEPTPDKNKALGFSMALQFISEGQTKGIDPIRIAKTIYKALTTKHPAPRYRITEHDIKWWVGKHLSDTLMDRYIAKHYGIK